jgi:hypothetical protein
MTLRWVLVHMIEETGRHAGHADILREQLDGSVGRGSTASPERVDDRSKVPGEHVCCRAARPLGD